MAKKNIFRYVIVIVTLFAGVTSANAQNDSVTINKYEYRALKMSTAVSKKSDRSCLDFYGENLDHVVMCGGWGCGVQSGYNDLFWKNDEGLSAHENNIELMGKVYYRFIHYQWISAIVPEADVYFNPSTTVEGLKNSFSIGIGGKVRFEFCPHGAIRPYIAPGVKTRNLTAYDALKEQKYDGNVVMYGGELGINIPLFKIWSKCQSYGETIHRASLVSLDICGTLYKGKTEKEWTDAQRYVNYTESGVKVGLNIKF